MTTVKPSYLQHFYYIRITNTKYISNKITFTITKYDKQIHNEK